MGKMKFSLEMYRCYSCLPMKVWIHHRDIQQGGTWAVVIQRPFRVTTVSWRLAVLCRKKEYYRSGLLPLTQHGKEQENEWPLYWARAAAGKLGSILEPCQWLSVNKLEQVQRKATKKTEDLEELTYEKRLRKVNFCSLAKQWLSGHLSTQKCPQLWASMERFVIQQDTHLKTGGEALELMKDIFRQ